MDREQEIRSIAYRFGNTKDTPMGGTWNTGLRLKRCFGSKSGGGLSHQDRRVRTGNSGLAGAAEESLVSCKNGRPTVMNALS